MSIANISMMIVDSEYGSYVHTNMVDLVSIHSKLQVTIFQALPFIIRPLKKVSPWVLNFPNDMQSTDFVLAMVLISCPISCFSVVACGSSRVSDLARLLSCSPSTNSIPSL